MYDAKVLLKYRLSPKGRYNAAKTRRRKAGRSFTISFKDWYELICKPCHYCNGPLNKQGLGLDRIDNTKGYTKKNVVQCCKNCNVMKNSFLTHDEMVVAMRAVVAFRQPKYNGKLDIQD